MAENEKKVMVKCPTCSKEKPWKDNPFRPFCSERCRLLDLGNWADGSYTIESSSPPDFDDDNNP